MSSDITNCQKRRAVIIPEPWKFGWSNNKKIPSLTHFRIRSCGSFCIGHPPSKIGRPWRDKSDEDAEMNPLVSRWGDADVLRVSIESVELVSSESLPLGSGRAPPCLRRWKNIYNRLKTSPIVISFIFTSVYKQLVETVSDVNKNKSCGNTCEISESNCFNF